jgi:putative peptidoglycan lipid II flippase
VGLAATQVNILLNSIFATSHGAGAVSYLNYAFRLMQFPIGIFGVSLASATLPLFSKHWAAGEATMARDTLERSLKQVFAINGPAAAGLGFLAVPIIALIYQRGAFSTSDTEAAASALWCYAMGLPFYSAVKVLVPICYAVGAVKISVVSSVSSVVLNLALNLALVGPYGHRGLALGTSATAALNAILLLGLLRGRVGIRLSALTLAVAKYGVLSVGMGFAVAWVQRILEPRFGIFTLGISMLVGVLLVAPFGLVPKKILLKLRRR